VVISPYISNYFRNYNHYANYTAGNQPPDEHMTRAQPMKILQNSGPISPEETKKIAAKPTNQKAPLS